MWGEGGLASEFDAFGFRIGPAPCRALGDAAAFEFRGNAKHGKDKLGEIARGIKHRLGNRPQARPARCMSRAMTRRSVVSRDRRSTAGIITTSPWARAAISFLSCGRSAVVPVNNALSGRLRPKRELSVVNYTFVMH